MLSFRLKRRVLCEDESDACLSSEFDESIIIILVETLWINQITQNSHNLFRKRLNHTFSGHTQFISSKKLIWRLRLSRFRLPHRKWVAENPRVRHNSVVKKVSWNTPTPTPTLVRCQILIVSVLTNFFSHKNTLFWQPSIMERRMIVQGGFAKMSRKWQKMA